MNNETTNKQTPNIEKKTIKFRYTAINPSGKQIKGIVEAINQAEALSFLKNKGLEIKSIKEDKLNSEISFSINKPKKLKYNQLSFFLTQLSTYVKSGIPLTDAMNIMAKQTKKKNEKLIYEKIVFELNKGENFSTAMSKQNEVFPKLLINMVKTSELTGNLTEVLDDMSDYYTTSEENRKQIISAMTYPSVIFIVAIAILTFIVIYVVPKFVGIYNQLDSELPGITKAIINLSDFVNTNIMLIVLGLGVFILIFVLMYKYIYGFRYAMQWLIMHIPVVKNIVIYKELIMFTKTFASLIKHDVFITDTMDILKRITNNEIYKVMINDSIDSLSKGEGISVAFQGQWAFPDVAYEMLLTGERTGKLGEMMDSVTRFYESSQKALINQLKSLIEPVMIVLLAIMVGIILMAVVIPMFDMYKNVL